VSKCRPGKMLIDEVNVIVGDSESEGIRYNKKKENKSSQPLYHK